MKMRLKRRLLWSVNHSLKNFLAKKKEGKWGLHDLSQEMVNFSSFSVENRASRREVGICSKE
jgi:hypothetical protein